MYNADLDLLLTFQQIVAHGSFKNAALRLNRTQSAVSMQMKRLEETLGHRLLQRNAQGVKLTAMGAVVLRYAECLHSLRHDLVEEMRGFDLEGEVQLGIPVDYVTDALTRILPLIKTDCPGVRLSVQCHLSRKLRRMVGRGEMDLAVVTREDGGEEGALLWRDPLAWYAGLGWDGERDPELPVALFEGDCILQDMMLGDLETLGRPYRVVLSSPHVQSLISAVETGFAVSLLPVRQCPADRFQPLFGGQGLQDHAWEVALISTDSFKESPLSALGQVIQSLYP